jgi:hypothetical protein
MNNIVLTLDTDWAPDFMIDYVAHILMEKQICATWFVTHQSPAIGRLRQYPHLFELGIHPNFLPNSTQGTTPGQVLRYCMDLVPDATSLRTHSLVQSTPLITQIIDETPIVTDVSLFIPYGTFLQPVKYQLRNRCLLRIPYFWADDYEMEQEKPNWKKSLQMTFDNGLHVFGFHPVHIYLNSPSMHNYYAMRYQLPHLSEGQITEFIHSGEGTRTLFLDLVMYLSNQNSSITIRDTTSSWLQRV